MAFNVKQIRYLAIIIRREYPKIRRPGTYYILPKLLDQFCFCILMQLNLHFFPGTILIHWCAVKKERPPPKSFNHIFLMNNLKTKFKTI